MSYSYVVDTFAWVEYLIGSRRGGAVKEYVEGGKAATPTIAILELAKWFHREMEAGRRTIEEMNRAVEFAKTTTLIVDLDEPMARKAGETDFLMKKKIQNWPVADSIVYATATTANAKVVTGDPHFRSFENAIMI
jgi:predicted nucleic acid-binding protein